MVVILILHVVNRVTPLHRSLSPRESEKSFESHILPSFWLLVPITSCSPHLQCVCFGWEDRKFARQQWTTKWSFGLPIFFGRFPPRRVFLPLTNKPYPHTHIHTQCNTLNNIVWLHLQIYQAFQQQSDTDFPNIQRTHSAGHTLRYLGEVESVDPGDLTEGAGSVEDHHDTDWTTRSVSKKYTAEPQWPCSKPVLCKTPDTHLSGLPGTDRRKRHLLAFWISSSFRRISLCRARHQSWDTVLFRFLQSNKRGKT